MRKYGLGTGLPETPPMQDEQQFRMFLPIYQALNALAKSASDAIGLTSLDPSDIQSANPFIEFSGNLGKRLNFKAAQDIPAGRLIWLDGTSGESKMWLADATAGVNRLAYGVSVETQTVVTGTRGRVILFDGLLTGVSGLAAGTVYWLGAGGTFSPAMPGVDGWSQQKVGLALTSNSIYVQITL